MDEEATCVKENNIIYFTVKKTICIEHPNLLVQPDAEHVL